MNSGIVPTLHLSAMLQLLNKVVHLVSYISNRGLYDKTWSERVVDTVSLSKHVFNSNKGIAEVGGGPGIIRWHMSKGRYEGDPKTIFKSSDKCFPSTETR